MKHALITGGSNGIGKELVYRFANSGAKVSFIYNKSIEKAEAIVKDLKDFYGINVNAFQCNISDEDAITDLFRNNKTIFSDVDVLINNAGITGTAKPFLMTSSSDWWKVMVNNVGGVINCTRKVLPTMIINKTGRIVNITSLSGLKGNPGMSAYSASKAAIVAFSKSLSKELKGTGIIINCLAPGFIQTDMTQDLSEEYYTQRMLNSISGRMGTVKEAAEMVLFLAKDAPDYFINQEVILDGGIS